MRSTFADRLNSDFGVGVFDAYKTVITALAAGGVPAQVSFGGENIDKSNWYDPTTGKFTPARPGIYQIIGQVMFPTGQVLGKYAGSVIRLNGVTWRTFQGMYPANGMGLPFGAFIALNGIGDYVDIAAYSEPAVNLAATGDSFFSGRFVSNK